jgi:hypothetical protein
VAAVKVIVERRIGAGVPALPWVMREYGEYGQYEGHAFITADPTGLARSVCDGFHDDMVWVVAIHNKIIDQGWRARLARRLLGVGHPACPPGERRRRRWRR